ncbi:FAD-dependent thymidylate synthase [bacterium]|nr:FAD-dependent thymidylate synthase [bacterium]
MSFELEYPRFIHSEFMTHRQFSRNAASSRAIPVKKLIELVRKLPAMPVHWGRNQGGMQAKEELVGANLKIAQALWKGTAKVVASVAGLMSKVGLHKQITNRILEPFQMIKVVMTTTEIENFFYLRNHKDAQPEIAELARIMWESVQLSSPQKLKSGEWHLPYVLTERGEEGILAYYTQDVDIHGQSYGIAKNYLTLEDAIKLSSSLCAQVSYRRSDESVEKAIKIYDQLVTMTPVHASPFEHQATPMSSLLDWDLGSHCEGVTHQDRYGNCWSGNLKGWIQNRQLIPNHVYTGDV